MDHYSVRAFAIVSLAPVPLLAAGSLWGAPWAWIALAYITVFATLMDEIAALVSARAGDTREFPAANTVSVVLALSHLALLPLAVWAISGRSGLSGWDRFAVFAAHGLYFGQVSNSNAHELIHRGARGLHRLGMWVYISLLFGHHTSAHPLVHHRLVASDDDPNSARMGESYWQFAPRAWIGSFRAGLRAETQRLARIDRPAWRNPYILYVGGGAAFLVLAASFGWQVLASYLGLALYATGQLLLSDYVQHYGLRRAIINGKLEPVGARHSWNAPHWFTTLMMLAAPRHSDHHAHPTRPYPELTLPADAPMLPRSLPVMATLALFPRLWRRVMDKRAARWQV